MRHAATGGAQDGVAGRGVPFHCSSEARVDVGFTGSDNTEFQGRTGRHDLFDLKARQKVFG